MPEVVLPRRLYWIIAAYLVLYQGHPLKKARIMPCQGRAMAQERAWVVAAHLLQSTPQERGWTVAAYPSPIGGTRE